LAEPAAAPERPRDRLAQRVNGDELFRIKHVLVINGFSASS